MLAIFGIVVINLEKSQVRTSVGVKYELKGAKQSQKVVENSNSVDFKG